MRAHLLRSLSKVGLGALTAALAVAASGSAEAASSAKGTLSELSLEVNKGLPTTINSGEFGIDAVKMSVFMAIDPVKGAGPMMKVDIPKGAVLEAHWTPQEKGRLKIKSLLGASNDGTLNVRYTINPTVQVKIALTTPVTFNATYTWTATDLINKLPGAKFNYDQKGSAPFAPWGFAPVSVKADAPPALDQSKIFGIPFQDINQSVADFVKGDVGLLLVTQPTFIYKTDKVGVAGADNVITSQDQEIGVPVLDGDYVELTTSVEGKVNVTGKLQVKPEVTIAQVNTGSAAAPNWVNVNSNFSFSVASIDYTANDLKVSFPVKIVHIPLPNVHPPDTGVDVGTAKKGGEVSEFATIKNSGELDAEVSFESSDPRFIVPSGKIKIDPKSEYPAKITFQPTDAEPVSAEITVRSDDPDSPVQTFKVGANGADVGAPRKPSTAAPGGTSSDSGCGCRSAGTSPGSLLALGGLSALALVAVRRRRRD
ncbi:MAG: hypothetical protein JNL38_12730 [Myxococcales bacterium]|jgi:MYXO-CTERM domain-containing protein|nr:hypothetical protein [Myxococcales bacterium]